MKRKRRYRALKPRPAQQRPDYGVADVPPATIQARCLEIQNRWSDATRERREVAGREDYTVPLVVNPMRETDLGDGDVSY